MPVSAVGQRAAAAVIIKDYWNSPPNLLSFPQLGLGGIMALDMRSPPKTARGTSVESWPKSWCYGFIAAAGLVGWLSILMGLPAIF